MDSKPRPLRQGDIYWATPVDPPAIPHPCVIVQEDVFNQSRVPTVIVCALTTNRKRAALPGNLLLDPGEGNLPRQSVVEVSKLSTLEKARLGEYIGSLNRQRVEQILAGIQFVQRMLDRDDPGPAQPTR